MILLWMLNSHSQIAPRRLDGGLTRVLRPFSPTWRGGLATSPSVGIEYRTVGLAIIILSIWVGIRVAPAVSPACVV